MNEEVKCVDEHMNAQNTKKIYALMKIKGNHRATKFQVDSGATCNVIPEANLPFGTEIKESDQKLSMYNQNTMPLQGTCKLQIRNLKNRKKYLVPFVVIKGCKQMPLLGSSTAQQMKLIEVKHENIAVTLSENCTVKGDTKTHTHFMITRRITNELYRLACKTKEEIFRDHACVFTGLGHLQRKVRLQIKPDSQPVVINASTTCSHRN